MSNKISGILPTSARIESVDMRYERPVRAGAASFGQPVALSSFEVRNREAAAAEALKATSLASLPKPQLSQEAVVKEFSDKFFMKKQQEKALEPQEYLLAETAPPPEEPLAEPLKGQNLNLSA